MNEKIATVIGVVGAVLFVLIVSGAVAGIASLLGAPIPFVMGAWYGGFVTSLTMAFWGISAVRSEDTND